MKSKFNIGDKVRVVDKPDKTNKYRGIGGDTVREYSNRDFVIERFYIEPGDTVPVVYVLKEDVLRFYWPDYLLELTE